jgi:diguanylate cyclase (GGDEF)-like protein/PAS domain S-box-containing protein
MVEPHMFIRVLDCISDDHNSTLVLLAFAVALFSGFTLFSIVAHIRARTGSSRGIWTLVAALAAGSGIWSTHFIAMLGFQPATVVSYDVAMTAMSAIFAIGFAGFAVPLLISSNVTTALTSGLLLTAAIGVMHFAGMRALHFDGALEWEPVLVVSSLCMGGLLDNAAIFIDRRRSAFSHRLAAGVLFGSAICTLHFTAMSAALFKVDPSMQLADGDLSEFVLGLSVALVTASLVLCSLVVVTFDRRAYRSAQHAQQMHSIIEATQTGIVICKDGEIIAANRAFERMVGHAETTIEGRALADFVQLPASGNSGLRLQETEAQLTTAKGATMDIALRATPVTSSGALQHVVEVRDIRDQKKARERMLHLANHDALTGLPNRRLLDTELRREAASGQEFSLLWIDLDHFKQVNDTYGHAVGDALLKVVAQRFLAALPEPHLLARVGGDEFVVLFRPSPGESDAVRAAESLLQTMSSPIIIEGRTLNVGLSIGMAAYPRDARSVDALMRRADTALYEAKKTGRSRYIEVA